VKPLVLIALLALAGCDRMFGINPDLGAGPDGGDGGDGDTTTTATFGETGMATYGLVTHDTTLDRGQSTSNYGADDALQCDGGFNPKVGLLQFDLVALPSTVTVVSATLRVYTESDVTTATVGVFQVMEAWDEGMENMAPGAANWTDRQPGVAWMGSGASPPSRAQASMTSFVPATASAAYDLALDPGVVQGWIADPATNFGVAFVCTDSNGTYFDAHEVATPATRPLLTITYRP